MYQIDVPTLYTSEVVSGFINVGDLCLAKDHVCHNVALESPTSGQNNTIKYYLTTAFLNSSKHTYRCCIVAYHKMKVRCK